MPHTTKKEYQKHHELPNCLPNTEVFYLPTTNEIFIDYDEYFERILQLYSSVWICSVTQRSGFTYDEALESEKDALDQVRSFPKSLRAPVLYLVHKFSHRARIDDLVNDVQNYIKDRFFLNEVVDFNSGSTLKKVKVVAIEYNSSKGHVNVEENDTIVSPNADCFRYSIQIPNNCVGINSDESGEENGDLFTDNNGVVKGDLSHKKLREKTAITRPKLKLFIKYNTEVNVDHFVAKADVIKQFKLDKMCWEAVFAGPMPKFPKTQRQKRSDIMKKFGDQSLREENAIEQSPQSLLKSAKSAKTESSISHKKKSDTNKHQSTSKVDSKKKKAIAEQQMELTPLFQIAEKFGIDNLEKWRQTKSLLTSDDLQSLREAISVGKENERIKNIEKRKREKEELIEWKKPRDDLLCDDLKPLPKYLEFVWPEWVPPGLYMDIISIYNFLVGFYEILPRHQQITLSELAFAFVTKKQDSTSHFYRLVKYLLENVGICVEEEEGDEADLENPDDIGNEQNKDIDHPVHGQQIRSINAEHALIRETHGFSVRHLKIDPATITEVVRLTLITSGYYTSMRRATRGGMRCFEDSGYIFTRANPEIMEVLEKRSIYDLNSFQRIDLIKVFIDQLLSYTRFRSLIEKRTEKLIELRRSIKLIQQKILQYDKDARAAIQAKSSVEVSFEQDLTKRSSKELMVCV